MPNKAVYFPDDAYAFLLEMASKEYPEGDRRLLSVKGKNKNVDPLSKLIQDAAMEKAFSIARKYHKRIPKSLQGETQA